MAKLNPSELKRARKELQNDARQRVVERGLLQFRADSQTTEAILQAADKHKMPVGALLRQWIQDRLVLEGAIQQAPDLVQRVTLLEEALSNLQAKLQ